MSGRIGRFLRRTWRLVSEADTVVGWLGHLPLSWTSITCVGAGVVVAVGGFLADMAAYIAVPLGGLAGGALGTLIVWLGRKQQVGSQQSDPIPAPNKEQPEACKITGARAASFKLYEAACLLVGEERAWPLKTIKSMEEYNTLCECIRTKQLDEAEGNPDDTLSFQMGFQSHKDLHIDRPTLRRYIALQNRELPTFILVKYDKNAFDAPDDYD